MLATRMESVLSSAQFFSTKTSELFVCRYVDNRLVLCGEHFLSHPCLKDFQHLSFYGGTIQLEEVTNHQFLGFRLNAADRTVTYMQPDKAWSIRNPLSAGSWSNRISGYLSRKALIVQYAWPPSCRSRTSSIVHSKGISCIRVAMKQNFINVGDTRASCLLSAVNFQLLLSAFGLSQCQLQLPT